MVVTVMEKKTDLLKSQIHHLEDTMIMYGIYNSDTLTALINTVQNYSKCYYIERKNLCR